MRVVKLEDSDDGKKAFKHLHVATRAGQVSGIEQIRRVGKILDKLEAIGTKELVPVADPETGEKQDGWRWSLQAGGGELRLEDAEYQELKQRFNAVQWHPDAARAVDKTFALLEAAPDESTLPKPALVSEPKPAEAAG